MLTARYALGDPASLPGAGWAGYYPAARADLYFLLDAGWAEDGRGPGANLWMNATKWPFDIPVRNDTTPTARLARFNAAVRARGWRGGALWFGALEELTKPGAAYSVADVEAMM